MKRRIDKGARNISDSVDVRTDATESAEFDARKADGTHDLSPQGASK
jgi:hypothetical protein